jgi:hypothetical protein
MVESFTEHLDLHDCLDLPIPKGTEDVFTIFGLHSGMDLTRLDSALLIEPSNLTRMVERARDGDQLVRRAAFFQELQILN